jgi:hypothetical protein
VLLQELEDNPGVVLSEKCYVHVIVAVGREGAGEAALALVDRMKDHNVQPSTRYVQLLQLLLVVLAISQHYV